MNQLNELDIYNHFDEQERVNSNIQTNIQNGGNGNSENVNVVNQDYITEIMNNINENNNIRKNIELSLCIHKQLNNYNKKNVKNIVNKLNK